MAALWSAIIAAPAVAAQNKANVGASLSIDGVFGIQGETDISSVMNDAPVSAQAFLKNFSQDLGPNVTWDTTAIGVAGIYDFSAIARMDEKVHPYAGLGLMHVSHIWNGSGNAVNYTGIEEWLYLVAGMRYYLAPRLDADFNYNNFGGLTVGLNLKF